jgi:DNA excision repair protein ERCC-4
MKKPLPTLIVDTREPPSCAWDLGLPSVRAKLESGDYAPQGLEHVAVIERKTLSDFLSSITFGRERFEAEMDRLKEYQRAIIVVEAHLDDVIDGAYRQGVLPDAAVGSVASIQARWGVATEFIGSRKNAEKFARAWILKVSKYFAHLKQETLHEVAS